MDPSAQSDEPRGIGLPEAKAKKYALVLTAAVRKAIDTHIPIGVSRPSEAHLRPSAFQGEAVQGEQVDLPIEVSNGGPGLLVMNAVGDCGCVVPESGPPVEPGKTGILRLRLETKEFVGAMDRNVFVYTNDPKVPVVEIPVHEKVSPRYRLLAPEGLSWVIDDGGSTGDLYFAYPKSRPIVITHLHPMGLDGLDATFEPWSGSLPDPELNEDNRPRKGYHIKVKVPDNVPAGRKAFTLAILTTDAVFPIIYFDVQVQKGIVALPEQLFVGGLGSKPKESVGTIIVSRPRRPFQLLSAKSDLASFHVEVLPGDQLGEWKLRVSYDGKARSGDLDGSIVIVTDDPKQPQIRIPITGSIS
jgi:hypothetical protein